MFYVFFYVICAFFVEFCGCSLVLYTMPYLLDYKKKPATFRLLASTRADEQTRTADLLITNEVRYHLCHVSVSFPVSVCSSPAHSYEF